MATLESSIRLNDEMSNTLLHIISVMDSTISVVDRMNSALAADADTSSFETMSRSIENVREQIRGLAATEIPTPEWQSDTGIEVFSTSGVERYRQEVGSLNDMMSRLAAAQERITHNAVYGNVLPPHAAADMINLNNRIQQIGQCIQEISSRPIDAVTPQELNQLEQLRGQLNTALQIQNEMNSAAENMDIEGANSAYLRLSQTVSSTERVIRDNTAEQENFNNTVEQGTAASNKLWDTVKKIGGAYVGSKGIEKLVEMSDNLVTARARLDMMSNGNGDELYEQVYQAAQNARGSLGDMADVVARFGNNAKDAFSVGDKLDTAQVVAFSELVQKQMTIAGASTQESANAMLQLSQALGSGVLRGDELNSIFEQAPNLIQGIADYLDVPIGKIREMASEGLLTADIVKNSVFAAAEDINAKFNAMPKTWGQMWQNMKNCALIALNPLLTRLNDMFNDERFQTGLQAVMDAFVVFADFALDALNAIAGAAAWVADNWETVGPIILTAAAAVIAYKGSALIAKEAQDLLNMAFENRALFKFLGGLGAFVVIMDAVRRSINNAYGTSFGFADFLGGVFMVIFAACGNLILDIANLFILLGNVGVGIWKRMCAVAENIAAAFKNALLSVQSWFYGFLESFWIVIEAVVEGLNKIPFANIDTDGIKNNAQKYAEKQAEVNGIERAEYRYDLDAAWNEGFGTIKYLDRIDYDEAFELGSELAKSAFGKENSDPNTKEHDYGKDIEDMLNKLGDINGNTDDIKNGLEITDEELKYLRDIAEQEAVNRFTTAEITIEQTNNNNVSSEMDLDGIVSGLTDMAAEAVEIISEGVHA